jgi:enamine deaminase RidA (YjgF/YER057c/UK114 family)
MAEGAMAKQYIQPQGLFPSKNFGFTQVVTSPPGTQVFISGQVAWNENFELVGGSDMAAQAEQALANLELALTSAGASPADIASLRIYVAGYTPEHAVVLAPLLAAFFDGSPPPAQTLLGVESLAAPDILIEIEALAVIFA